MKYKIRCSKVSPGNIRMIFVFSHGWPFDQAATFVGVVACHGLRGFGMPSVIAAIHNFK